MGAALARCDQRAVEKLQSEIEASGGLDKYQQASIQGQAAVRGGDSSKVLMEWLQKAYLGNEAHIPGHEKLRMLEVGSLRIDNACARSGWFKMERIDLHSQHPLIKEEDFMHRPVPTTQKIADEGFDVVSLSLVVNFVADAAGRGKMLERVSSFFRKINPEKREQTQILPALFLVLPAPCVTNSRYLDEERLEEIMKSLGYASARRKTSAKLVYYLWTYDRGDQSPQRSFKKEEIRPGASRNNFSITLRKGP